MLERHRQIARTAAAAALAALTALAAEADAAERTEPARATLRVGTELSTCVQAHSLEVQIQEALGRGVFSSDEESDVTVVIASAEGEHTAVIELQNSQTGAPMGTRTLQATSCQELTETLALTLSLMLDFTVEEIAELEERARADAAAGERTVTTPEAEPAPEPPAPESDPKKIQQTEAPAKQPAPEPPKKVATVEAPDAAAGAHPRWTLGLDARLGWGAAPTTSVGADVAAGVAFAPLLVELALGHWLEHRFSRQGGEVSLERQDVRLLVCPLRTLPPPWALSVCSSTDASLIRARSAGFEQTDSTTGFTFGVGAGLEVRYAISPHFFVRTYAGASVGLQRARLVAERDGEAVTLYEMSPLSGMTALGFGFQL